MQREVYEFISKETNDPLVEWKTCVSSCDEFPIFFSEQQLLSTISPVCLNSKINIPLPQESPFMRRIRRASCRAERHLHKRELDDRDGEFISLYSPAKPFPVYHFDFWSSDQWDPFSYGMDFDFNRTFFEQFAHLQSIVPRMHIHNGPNNHNSDYTNHAGNVKNCYLCFATNFSEDCLYCRGVIKSHMCFDCLNCQDCENCYECIDCHNCFAIFWGQSCFDCTNSTFMFDCTHCNNCLGCVGLQNKSYCIFNKQYSQEEFTKKLTDTTFDIIKKDYLTLKNDLALPALITSQSEDAIGCYLTNVKKALCCFDVFQGENIRYCDTLYGGVTQSADITSFGIDIQYSYQCASSGYGLINCLFCTHCRSQVHHLFYCDLCNTNTHDCFGCVGLYNKQYSILNKQYSKGNYELMVTKIIHHMQETGERGQYFPPSCNVFSFNESIAPEYYDRSKEKALENGFVWDELLDKQYDGSACIPKPIEYYINNPEKQKELLQGIITCKESGRAFKITSQELSFYCKHGLQIPELHSDVRHKKRMDQRAQRDLFLRCSDKSGKQLLSVYPQDSPFKVYSEQEYRKEVFG